MRYKLFLDDDRYPPIVTIGDNDWRIARNYHDAVWYVMSYGLPYHISFDHDLGAPQNMTGYDFTKWFCNYIMDNQMHLPADFSFYVHSMNPVGAKNIQMYMDQFMKDY